MNRLTLRCAGLALFGLAAVSLSGLSAADKKAATIEEIMEKAHKKGGALPAIAAELKGEKVNWDAVESKTKDLLLLAGDLSKNKPSKGEQANWDKLTKAYMANVEKLEKATKDKNVADARAAQKALSGSCAGCHKAHKP